MIDTICPTVHQSIDTSLSYDRRHQQRSDDDNDVGVDDKDDGDDVNDDGDDDNDDDGDVANITYLHYVVSAWTKHFGLQMCD
jgi:hypothetical protein